MTCKYDAQKKTLAEKISSLIKDQTDDSADINLIMETVKPFTLPATIPASISSVLFIQMRMVTTIARMCGYDIDDCRIKSLIYVCLTGNQSKKILEKTEIKNKTSFSVADIEKISDNTYTTIKEKVVFYLLPKFNKEDIIDNWGIISDTPRDIEYIFNILETKTIGEIAKEFFLTHSLKN